MVKKLIERDHKLMIKKSYKFLIIASNASSYDARMVKGLRKGFESLGFIAADIAHPINIEAILGLCNSQGFNVVIQINGIKPAVEFPKHIRYISWIQDVFIDTCAKISGSPLRDGDILYTLGSPRMLGLKIDSDTMTSTLFTGVSPEILNYKNYNNEGFTDFSLCGYIPNKLVLSTDLKKIIVWHLDRLMALLPLIGNISISQTAYLNGAAILMMSDLVSSCYKPLTGSLDIDQLEKEIRDITKNYSDIRRVKNKKTKKLPYLFTKILNDYRAVLNFNEVLSLNKFEKAFLVTNGESAYERAVKYFSQSYPRLLDRVDLLELALSVSSSLEIYGPDSWLTFPEFTSYYKGNILNTNELLDVYLRSKINLSNNTHGLGLHSRVFECMSVGGFIFNHESPNDNISGGILTEFEPGVHFGQYSKLNFNEEANKWLKNDISRIQIGQNARKLIAEKHLWRHRAEKIINDLSS